MKNPHLKQNKIAEHIRDIIIENEEQINLWFKEFFKNTPPLFYNSVDLRNSGYKIAPVDTNLFPAGFNNLTTNQREASTSKIEEWIKENYPHARNILLIVEDHTRNLFYLDNVVTLKNIIENTGLNLKITSFDVCKKNETIEIESHSGEPLIYEPFLKKDYKLQDNNGFIPDLIIINNDLTNGAPELVQNIQQTVIPPIGLGWYQRRKTSHFDTYNNIAQNFSERFGLDPWLLTTIFRKCGKVNFKDKQGIECVAKEVDTAIKLIQAKYDEYGIKEKPFVFIKSNRGTYGMGIMTANSGDEIIAISKNIRKKMNVIKGGEVNTEVIIQEGIPTIDKIDSYPAEPMIYLIANEAVGCFYRYNTEKDPSTNLNSKGMKFANNTPNLESKQVCKALGTIAKLASYAAAWECYTDSYSI